MPHTNRKSNVPPPPYKPATFVNIALAPDDKARIKAQPLEIDALDTCLENLTRSGYKITLRFDERNDCYAAWLIAPDSSPNKGCILAGRGSTPLKSLKQAVYIHLVLLEENWVDGSDQQRDVIDD